MSTTSSETIGRGWRRPDGRIGVRNHVVVLSTVALTDRLATLAGASVEGVLTIAPAFERGLRGRDAELQERVVDAIVRHPNTGAILLLTHDPPAARRLEERFAEAATSHGPARTLRAISLMGAGSYDAALEAAVEALETLRAAARAPAGDPLALAELCVALECGGSDATSSACANPAIGRFVDRLVAAGGTAIVSETAEFIGAEAIVRERAVDAGVAERVVACLQRVERLMGEDGVDYRGVNPTAENIEAGLTTLVEKTMGALCKIGSSPIAGCLDYAETPAVPGLHFMDTPFFSPVSLSGMMAAGCQLTLFGMGVFNPSGNPLTPTVKVCGNPQTLAAWGKEIDVDVGGVIDASLSPAGAGEAVAEAVRKVVAGTLTRAERRGEGQVIVPRSVPAL